VHPWVLTLAFEQIKISVSIKESNAFCELTGNKTYLNPSYLKSLSSRRA